MQISVKEKIRQWKDEVYEKNIMYPENLRYYANEFVKKMNTYVMNDLLPRRDVVLTFESKEKTLDVGVVKKLVQDVIR